MAVVTWAGLGAFFRVEPMEAAPEPAGEGPPELIILEDQPCRCPDCDRRRAEGCLVTERSVNAIPFDPFPGSPSTVYVNGRVAHAYWPHPSWTTSPATGQQPGIWQYAEGEVLERAVKLAMLAHPETMRNFHCGRYL